MSKLKGEVSSYLEDRFAKPGIILANDSTSTTDFTLSAPSGNQLSVNYVGMPGNRPSTYGNYIVIFKNQSTIPYNDPNPETFELVTGDSSQGTQVVPLTLAINTSYIVGYAVGSKLSSGSQQEWGNIVSTGFIPASSPSDPSTYTYFQPALTQVTPQANSVTMNYSLPTGCTPKSNGAWVAIWQSGSPSYTLPPMGAAQIALDSASGSAAINGVDIVIGQTYTVGLFMSGWQAAQGGANIQTSLACSSTFST